MSEKEQIQGLEEYKKVSESNQKFIDKMEKDIEKRILTNYQESLKKIRAEISRVYEKYDGNIDELQKYNRLTILERKIMEIIKELSKNTTKELLVGIGLIYNQAYMRTFYEIEKVAGAVINFVLLDKETINQAILNPADRIGFINRMKDNHEATRRSLMDILIQGFIQGLGFAKVSKSVRERFGQGAYNSLRIVRTEGMRVRNAATQKSREVSVEAGVDLKKRWVSTLDTRTRDSHKDLDGVTIGVDEYFTIGTDKALAPLMFAQPQNVIQCRCTTISIVEGFEPKTRRSKADGIVKNMNYREWEKWKKEGNK
jgi:SPP1 gp7 family putative phage head morphogenesis protein